MLAELRVKNLAIIEEATLSLAVGMTVLTGETGAGKSILLEALGLALGGRAATDGIRSGCEEAEVEALFMLQKVPEGLRAVIPGDSPPQDVLVRRVISRSGRNRVTVNGGLATLAMLESIGASLVEIHSQQEHLSLRERGSQLDLLDGFGGLNGLRGKIEEGYGRLQGMVQRVRKLKTLDQERVRQEDFLKHQEREIDEACLKPGEDEALIHERQLLTHSEKLSSLCELLYQTLYEEEDSVLARLSRTEGWFREMAAIDGSAEEAVRMVSASALQLREAVLFLRDYRGRIEFQPERLAQVEERLHTIEKLKKKYGTSIAEILEHLGQVQSELGKITSAGEEAQRLSREAEALEREIETLAEDLSEKRRSAVEKLELKVDQELSCLGMERARFRVQLTRSAVPGPSGFDRIAFLLAGNPGEEPKPLARTASGGELSRVMLALKVVLASGDSVPTLVFDEVDAGVGGRIAEEVGNRLKRLSRTHQVACVTHLPQIASQADHHFRVEKVTVKGRTKVQVHRLNAEERVEEIARMLGGKTVSGTARRHAEEMLGRKAAEA